jgi:hypothetical protein
MLMAGAHMFLFISELITAPFQRDISELSFSTERTVDIFVMSR